MTDSTTETTSASTPALNARLRALTSAIAADMRAIKEARHVESGQINANFSALSAEIAALIDDKAAASTSTWSSTQIESYVAAQLSQALGGITPAILSTIQNLVSEEASENGSIQSILSLLANVVRFDQAQALTAAEALQARENIGAVSESDVAAAISAAFTDEDLAASYTTAATPAAATSTVAGPSSTTDSTTGSTAAPTS